MRAGGVISGSGTVGRVVILEVRVGDGSREEQNGRFGKARGRYRRER